MTLCFSIFVFIKGVKLHRLLKAIKNNSDSLFEVIVLDMKGIFSRVSKKEF